MTNPFSLYNQFKIAVINDRIDNCIDNFKVLLKNGQVDIKKTHGVDFQKVCEPPDVEYRALESKFLLYEPSSNPSATVFFTNFVDGWYTAVLNYTRLFKKEAFLVGFTMKAGKYNPSWLFNHFDIGEKGVVQRVVYLIKEDKWIFHEEGNPLRIEDVANYGRRNKTDRLTNEIILGILKSAGFDLSQSDFFETNNKAYLCKYQ